MKNAPRINVSVDPGDEDPRPTSGAMRKKPQQFGIGRWITYINSAEYRQIHPGNAVISESDLQSHNKPDDIWMALNHEGKRAVFDVTPFSCCHPGGLEVLLEHAGTDATEAFRMAHAYVNVDMIGRLRKGFLSRSKLGAGRKPNQLLPSMIVSSRPFQQSTKPKWKWVVSESGSVAIRIHFPRFATVARTWSWLEDLRALAHWTPQKESVDTPNVSQLGQLLIRTLLDDGKYHRMEFRELSFDYFAIAKVHGLVDDYFLYFIQLNVLKQRPRISLSRIFLQSHLSSLVGIQTIVILLTPRALKFTVDPKFFQCSVVESRMVDRTPYRFLRLSWSNEKAWIPVPLGHHIILRLSDGSGQSVYRPYTPVCSQILPDRANLRLNLVQNTELSLLIKIYPNGLMSQMLDQLKEGDRIEASLPVGQFSCAFLHSILIATNRTQVFMLSAGSGITPMLRLLPALLLRDDLSLDSTSHETAVQCPTVRLVCFDRTEEDQVLVTELAELEAEFSDRITRHWHVPESNVFVFKG
ncbi:Cytochrome b5 reductase 4 [Fasciola gigantica]|uniref:Cytochrome b5 reductase 4 n=1 Tax=Fasciola gigantica TaxID=46835 RepID=A0A504Y869_FASGI|nr:Cytochrome b5 reductase 4 [Fasciola gigantica]